MLKLKLSIYTKKNKTIQIPNNIKNKNTEKTEISKRPRGLVLLSYFQKS